MNFKISKFYDTAIAENAGGATEVADKPNIAELMGKQGVVNSSSEMVAKPIEIQKEVKGEVEKEVNSESAATATKDEPAKETKPGTKENPVEVEQVSKTPQVAEVPKAQLTLDEVLKNEQPNTILKKLGLDDSTVSFLNDLKGVDPKMIALLNYYKENGDIKPYVNALNTDYSKMSSEDVMRHQLREEYPKASDKQIDILFKKEVVDAYNLNSEDEEEVENGKLLLDAKADKFRDVLSSKQNDFLIPKLQPKAAPEPDTQALEVEKRFESYKTSVNNSPITKDIFSNKAISIGEGEDKFSYAVDPVSLTDILYDSDKWTATMFDIKKNADGNDEFIPNVRNQMLIAAFAQNPDKFLSEYSKHFKSLGGKTVVDSIDNVKKPESTASSKGEGTPKTAAEAMAKGGVINSGGRGY